MNHSDGRLMNFWDMHPRTKYHSPLSLQEQVVALLEVGLGRQCV